MRWQKVYRGGVEAAVMPVDLAVMDPQRYGCHRRRRGFRMIAQSVDAPHRKVARVAAAGRTNE